MQGRDEAWQSALATLSAAPPAELLATPLDYIFAEHFRQRTLCYLLERIADSGGKDRETVEAVCGFLLDDMTAHVVDEEEDLFPLIRRRATPDDRIEPVLAGLAQEHAADRLDAESIIEGLSERKRQMSRRFRDLLRRFAANERHHLIVENAIVLPIARVRLTLDDLRNLGRRMATRRGVEYPGSAHAV